MDSKRLRPRKLIRQLPLQPKTHFGYIHTRAGAPGTTRLSMTNGKSVIREIMPKGLLWVWPQNVLLKP